MKPPFASDGSSWSDFYRLRGHGIPWVYYDHEQGSPWVYTWLVEDQSGVGAVIRLVHEIESLMANGASQDAVAMMVGLGSPFTAVYR